MSRCCRSPSESVNNVTVVEVINHNQVFNFNQIEQELSQTEQLPQTSSELINSPRRSRSTSSSTSETSVVSPRHSSRHNQNHNTSAEELANNAMSASHIESNDRTTNNEDELPRSSNEITNESQRHLVRLTELEEAARHRRRQKRHEVELPAINQEVTSNYEHLVLSTAGQTRPTPALSNLIPANIVLLPTRPQVNIFFVPICYLHYVNLTVTKCFIFL